MESRTEDRLFSFPFVFLFYFPLISFFLFVLSFLHPFSLIRSLFSSSYLSLSFSLFFTFSLHVILKFNDPLIQYAIYRPQSETGQRDSVIFESFFSKFQVIYTLLRGALPFSVDWTLISLSVSSGGNSVKQKRSFKKKNSTKNRRIFFEVRCLSICSSRN